MKTRKKPGRPSLSGDGYSPVITVTISRTQLAFIHRWARRGGYAGQHGAVSRAVREILDAVREAE